MADTPTRWREPSSLLPLRWGTWLGRSLGGLTLIVSGGVAIAGTTASTAWLAAAGVIAHVVGWSVMPARGWRRIVVIVPSTFAMLALLSGPGYLMVLVIPFFGWLLVRHRPLRVWPMAVFVVASGFVVGRISPGYDGMLFGLAVSAVVLTGSAWAARAVHAATMTRQRPRRTFRRGGPQIS